MYFPSFRKKKNGAPVLSKFEIEQIAEGYIRDFCPQALYKPMATATKLIRDLPPQPDNLRIYAYVKALQETYKMSWHAAGNRLRALGIVKEQIPSEACLLDFMYD